MALPEDLAPALTDGVVLCHLANHVRPRSVASIHVPSPAVVSSPRNLYFAHAIFYAIKHLYLCTIVHYYDINILLLFIIAKIDDGAMQT